jgi:hypothetical protein
MVEISCQSCGQAVHVASILAGPETLCCHCGQPLLTRPAPSSTSTQLPSFALPAGDVRMVDRRGSQRGELPHLVTGAVVGIAGVIAFDMLKDVLPLPVQGVVLGTLAGVLLAPFIGLGIVLSMIFQPYSLRGMASESVMNRLATQIIERNYRGVVTHLSIFVILGMAIGGFCGFNVKGINTVLFVGAVLGGGVLGAVAGILIGSLRGQAHPAPTKHEISAS